jgi:hypothetical protein
VEGRIDDSKAILRALWEASGDPTVAVDEECSPTKVCRNMRDVTFDGFADQGADPAAAWREQLAREGKLDPSAGSVRDLVLGTDHAR